MCVDRSVHQHLYVTLLQSSLSQVPGARRRELWPQASLTVSSPVCPVRSGVEVAASSRAVISMHTSQSSLLVSSDTGTR